MKKITLNHIVSAEKSSIYLSAKCYSVHLGNGITVRFSDGKAARAFLVEVNEDLNFCLVMLNQIYMEVHNHFRRVWFYTANGNNGQRRDIDIVAAFHQIDTLFNLMVTRSHYTNGNHFVFKYMLTCLEHFENIVTVLQDVEMNRNAYAEYRMLKVILTKTDTIRTEVSTMGLGRGTVEIREGQKAMG